VTSWVASTPTPYDRTPAARHSATARRMWKFWLISTASWTPKIFRARTQESQVSNPA
jgi:hypothetical protein